MPTQLYLVEKQQILTQQNYVRLEYIRSNFLTCVTHLKAEKFLIRLNVKITDIFQNDFGKSA